MSIIKHRYINKPTKYKLPKNKTKSNGRPINKMIKYSNRNLNDIISKRYLFISICLVLFFIIIIIRLFNLQVNNYDKYLLDIDKVLHFPITFVIKTNQTKESVLNQLETYIDERANGMVVIEENYRKAIEEIITINELQNWIVELDDKHIDQIIRDIDIYYRLEMNMEDEE